MLCSELKCISLEVESLYGVDVRIVSRSSGGDCLLIACSINGKILSFKSASQLPIRGVVVSTTKDGLSGPTDSIVLRGEE